MVIALLSTCTCNEGLVWGVIDTCIAGGAWVTLPSALGGLVKVNFGELPVRSQCIMNGICFLMEYYKIADQNNYMYMY